MEKKSRRQEDCICDKNCAVPVIITLKENSYSRLPTSAPVSDDKSSIDYLLGHTPTEPEGDFVSGDADYGPSNPPSPSSSILYKITPPSHPSPPNTSQGGDIYQYEPKRKYQRKQCPEAVLEQVNDGKMKRVEFNKLNRQLYDLTFGPQNIPSMSQKIPKKRISFNYKQ